MAVATNHQNSHQPSHSSITEVNALDHRFGFWNLCGFGKDKQTKSKCVSYKRKKVGGEV